jgi:DNA polymerase-3 subunit alpha (Gram-positive type)
VLAIPEHRIQLADIPCKRQRGFEETKFSNITPKGKYQDIVVIDTETTGLAPSKDRIVELAAIRYVDEKPVERFQTYINPEITIPDAARKVNGITDEMVAGAPTIGQVMPDFDAFVGESTLVAHNLAFDLKFIYYSGSQVMNKKRRYIDTLEQARRIIKRDDIYDYTLDSLCTHYYITNAKAHSALADADATGALFFALVSEVQ